MERRKETRYVVLFRMTFTSSIHESGEGALLDVSLQGCMLATPVSLRVGQELILHLYPPETIFLIEALAIVRWATEGEAGLEFLDVPSEDAHALHDLVASLDNATMKAESAALI
jgi:hypothetical protein